MVPEHCSWRSDADVASMNPCWCVMVALQSRWNVPFDGAFVNDGGAISWISRNSSKPGRPDELDCWTILSDRDWAASNLAMAGENVAEYLVAEMAKVYPVSMPTALFRQSHRWLYASARYPMANETGCAWDETMQLGACGDWFGKDNVEGAMLSGLALAGRVLGSANERAYQNHLTHLQFSRESLSQLTLKF